MTAMNPAASRQAVVEAALVLLEQMGLSAAVSAGTRRAPGAVSAVHSRAAQCPHRQRSAIG